MEETAPATSRKHTPWWRRTGALICGAAALFAATEYLAAAWLHKNPYTLRIPLSLLVLLALAAGLIIAGAVVRGIHHWVRPIAPLRDALHEIHQGELPIDQLPEQLGALTTLRPVLLQILRDLRQQKAEIATLQHEMRQRVAQRTDAMARQIGSLRVQASLDPLTGLFNRRSLDESLEQMLGHCTRDDQPFSLLMIDVDDFKVLNDTLGHSAGDALLRSIGQLIRSTIRHDDCAFRCGGDEFVVALPRTAKAEADALAKRMTDLVEALAKTLPLTRKPRLSIGIATHSGNGTPATTKTLMEAADQQLYAIKALHKKARSSAA